jgi:alpha-glucosidase
MIFGSNDRFYNETLYINAMRPLFIKKALFSDTTSNYVSPAEPEPDSDVKIRFRTAKNNVDAVSVVTEDGIVPMEKESSSDFYDFYATTVHVGTRPIKYYFKIESGNFSSYYDVSGPAKYINPEFEFEIIPGFHTPEWAKGAVMYQIFVERFCNGDPTNDVETGEYFYVGGESEKIEDWYAYPKANDIHEFYGGDLQGVMDKLDYLKDLGIDAIYFNPLFVSPSNHKYDSQDYEHIDPHFGKIVKDGGNILNVGDSNNTHATKYQIRVCDAENLEASDRLFAELVEKAHSMGIRVILDGVFNHCGSFNKWLDRERIYEGRDDFKKGAYVAADSPYRHYFDFKNKQAWPYNGSYDGWWGYDTLPKLNYEGSPELFENILNIAKKWMSPPFNCDGWRLDVAADIGHSAEFNHYFFKRFREAVKEANPNALILAEHYGDPKAWLNGKEWDSVMNYDGFMEPVSWFLTGMQKHSDDFNQGMWGNSDAFFGAMLYAGNRFTNSSLEVSMNQLSNHDHSRFLTRTNQVVGRSNTMGSQAADAGVLKSVMRLGVMMQMTWTGAPTLYYGDEAGLAGFTDPDNRRTYPWGREDWDLINFHKAMIAIHKDFYEFKKGSIKKLNAEYALLSYARFTDDDCSVIIINRDNHERQVNIPIWQVIKDDCKNLKFKVLIESTDSGFTTEEKYFTAGESHLDVTMPPISGMVLKKVKE